MPFYLLFNGPPKSGKSTLAREAIRIFSRKGIETRHESFAGPMKQFMSVLLGQPYSSISKDEHHPVLGETPREFLIRLSERYLKPTYGHTFFGRAVTRRTQHLPRPHVFIIDDSGFTHEFSQLPRKSTCLVRIIRPGFNFSSDSRSYLPRPNLTIINDADLQKALSLTSDVVDYCISKWRIK